jgi:hypothetical protein
MDTVLILITGLSLALAGVMALLVWTMVREERRRSDARVAVLMDLAGEGGAPHKGAPYHRPPSPRRSEAPYSEQTADLPLRAGASAPADLFVQPERRTSWGPRIALAAGVLAVLIGVGFTVLPPAGGSARIPLNQPAQPLELLTLRHAAAAGSLTVSGIVRNPGGGAPLSRIDATAYALGPDGTVLASARAPIDIVTFGPGEESPFVVEVAVGGPVARYRVGFRDDAGRVIAHVDRRAGVEAVAQK